MKSQSFASQNVIVVVFFMVVIAKMIQFRKCSTIYDNLIYGLSAVRSDIDDWRPIIIVFFDSTS